MDGRWLARGAKAHHTAWAAVAALGVLHLCHGVACAEQDRSSANEKGSLVIYPHVEVRWDNAPPFPVIQDTFVHLSNDFPSGVDVKLFFFNGDAPQLVDASRWDEPPPAAPDRADRTPSEPDRSTDLVPGVMYTRDQGTGAFTQLTALEHGVAISMGLMPKCEGDMIEGTMTVSYNDDFGDSTEISDAFFLVGPGGERFPPEGSHLEILEVVGNTTATVGGSLPIVIGQRESFLSGLPGAPQDGRVRFRVTGYLIDEEPPDDIQIFGYSKWRDLCDHPDTSGCNDTDTLDAIVVANTGHHPRIAVEKTADVSFVCEGEDTPVTFTYTVTNPGNVPLGAVMATISDDSCDNMVFVGGDTNNNMYLDTNEQWVFECSADVDTTNSGTVYVMGMTDVPLCDASAQSTLTIPSAICGERDHPGWNHFDSMVMLTANQPAYWSAASGLPVGFAPWRTLDPGGQGQGPGRPDPDDPSQRYLRGFVVAFAVQQVPIGDEIRWNHLSGDATIVNYAEGHAWQYGAPAFQVVDEFDHGAATGTPGELFLDGTEYAPHGQELLFNFIASNSDAYSGGGIDALHDTALTLMPLYGDFRQETEGPRTTKASFDVWNENEVKFTNLDLCITCWSSVQLSRYPTPNHFLIESLQTNAGKARIDGLTSDLCAPDAALETALLGVAARHIAPGIAAGHNLFDIGFESGHFKYDTRDPPPGARSSGSGLGGSSR